MYTIGVFISIIGASYNNSIYFKLNITLNEFKISSKGILNNRGYSICCDIVIINTVKILLFTSFLIIENGFVYEQLCVLDGKPLSVKLLWKNPAVFSKEAEIKQLFLN